MDYNIFINLTKKDKADFCLKDLSQKLQFLQDSTDFDLKFLKRIVLEKGDIGESDWEDLKIESMPISKKITIDSLRELISKLYL